MLFAKNKLNIHVDTYSISANIIIIIIFSFQSFSHQR